VGELAGGEGAGGRHGSQTADELVRYLLLDRHWLVYDTPPLLVTCDEPVVALAGPEGERGEQGGFGDPPSSCSR